MNIKVFKVNANGKIEFTRPELEKMLNEIYNEGYIAGEKHTKESYYTWAPTLYNLTNTTILSDTSAISLATKDNISINCANDHIVNLAKELRGV